MTSPRPLAISMENLGPVREARLEVKPLTILIGPNNSGKTYAAQLLYALFKALWDRLPLSEYAITDEARDPRNQDLYSYLIQKTQGSSELILDNLPPALRTHVREQVQAIQDRLKTAIPIALQDYFGADSVTQLVRDAPERTKLAVTFNDGALSFTADSAGALSVQLAFGWPSAVSVSRDDLDSFRHAGIRPDVADWSLFLATKVWQRSLDLNSLPTRGMFYAPSYRSGVLYSLDFMIRFSLQVFTADWFRRNAPNVSAVMPRPNGIFDDFVSQVMSRDTNQDDPDRHPLKPALDLLERSILEGSVSQGDIGEGQSMVLYHQDGRIYPLYQTSSMVAELAPLDILLRRRLRPGDFLIIDEPEAHLHPENQRRIARVIVRLVRVGVRVVCTTHSSTFLHQISNHLLASAASADARMSLGFDKNDVIVSDEVGVYLFGKSKAGTRVRSVPIEPGFGISEDEFVRVAEEIGDESYTLASAVGAAIGGRE